MGYSDKSISASFEAVAQYTLTSSTVGSGDIGFNPPGGTYYIGTSVAVRATPQSGFQFDGWTGDIKTDQNPIEVFINKDKDITANFSEQSRSFIEYNISAVTASTHENPNV